NSTGCGASSVFTIGSEAPASTTLVSVAVNGEPASSGEDGGSLALTDPAPPSIEATPASPFGGGQGMPALGSAPCPAGPTSSKAKVDSVRLEEDIKTMSRPAPIVASKGNRGFTSRGVAPHACADLP